MQNNEYTILLNIKHVRIRRHELHFSDGVSTSECTFVCVSFPHYLDGLLVLNPNSTTYCGLFKDYFMSPPAPYYIILIVYTLLFHQPDLFTPVLVDLFPVIARSRPHRSESCHCVLSSLTNNFFVLCSIYLRTMLKTSNINKVP